jgi:hypothetical protein
MAGPRQINNYTWKTGSRDETLVLSVVNSVSLSLGTIFALDPREPMYEHVIEHQDLVVEETVFHLARSILTDMLSVYREA